MPPAASAFGSPIHPPEGRRVGAAAHSHPIAAYKPGLFAAAGEGENAVYEFASGVAAPVAVGLMGTQDPPLSPEPIAPAPSNFEAPAVPLRSFEAILAEHTSAPRRPSPATVSAPEPIETRRIVLRMLGGEQLELAAYDDRDEAVEAARELMTRFSSAESAGEWPELDGRFVRPASVASIDVLSTE